MTNAGPLPTPGWYADPGGSGGLRYWDGRGWTEHVTAPAPAPMAAAPYAYGPSPMATGVPATVARPSGRKVWPWFVGIGALFVAGVISAAVVAAPKVARAGGRVTDIAAQSSAHTGVNAGEQIYALDGSFAGVTKDRLQKLEGALTFTKGPSSDFTTASFDAGEDRFTVAVQSLSGRCYVASIGAEVGGPRRTGRLRDDQPCWATYAADKELIPVDGF